MKTLRKAKRQVTKILFKLFDKHDPGKVTLTQARSAIKSIKPRIVLNTDVLYGYRGAYAASKAREKKARRR